jgi:hypothetical protein
MAVRLMGENFPARTARRGGFEPEPDRMKREIFRNRRSLFAIRPICLMDCSGHHAINPHQLEKS